MDRGGSKLRAPAVEVSPSKKTSPHVIDVGGFQFDKIAALSCPGLTRGDDQRKLDLNSFWEIVDEG
jgi:hypothetical protein